MVCGYLGVEENFQLDPDSNVNLARQSILGVLVINISRSLSKYRWSQPQLASDTVG